MSSTQCSYYCWSLLKPKNTQINIRRYADHATFHSAPTHKYSQQKTIKLKRQTDYWLRVTTPILGLPNKRNWISWLYPNRRLKTTCVHAYACMYVCGVCVCVCVCVYITSTHIQWSGEPYLPIARNLTSGSGPVCSWIPLWCDPDSPVQRAWRQEAGWSSATQRVWEGARRPALGCAV